MRRCVLVVAVVAFGAVARMPGAAAEPFQIIVMIVPEGEEEALSAAIQAVESQLADLDVSFQLERVEAFPDKLSAQIEIAADVAMRHKSLSVIWCDSSNSDQVLLYLSEATGDRLLVRRIKEVEAGGRAETLAVIVRASVNAMLRGGEIGVAVSEIPTEQTSGHPERPAADRDEVSSESPPGPEQRHLVWLQVAYAMYVHSRERPVIHGGHMAIGVRVFSSLSIVGGYAILQRIESTGDSGTLELARHPVELGLAWEIALGSFTLSPSLQLWFDVAVAKMRSDRAEVAPRDNRDFVFSLLPALELGYDIFERFSLFLCAAAEVSLNAVHYVVDRRSSGKETLIDSWPVQPWIFAGLKVEIF